MELRRLLGSVDDGEHIAPDKITLETWAGRWIGLLERRSVDDGEEEGGDVRPKGRQRGRISRRTRIRYTEVLRNYVVPVLGKRPLQKLQATEIDELYVALGKRLAPATVQYAHVVLGSCLTSAVNKGLMKNNPCERTEALPSDDEEHGTVSPEAELMKLMEGFKDSTLYEIACVACLTGMRRGEILALRWSDFDAAAKTLRVAQALEYTAEAGPSVQGAEKQARPSYYRNRRLPGRPASQGEGEESPHTGRRGT